MEALTKTTWLEVVHSVWPGVSEELASDLLWTTTCFPAGGTERVMEMLREYHVRSGGNAQEAINLSYKDMDEEWARVKEQMSLETNDE